MHFYFNGKCFICHNFGHKAPKCVAYKTIMTREARKQNNEVGVKKYSYNSFSPIQYETKCSFWNKFGHKEFEFMSKGHLMPQDKKM